MQQLIGLWSLPHQLFYKAVLLALIFLKAPLALSQIGVKVPKAWSLAQNWLVATFILLHKYLTQAVEWQQTNKQTTVTLVHMHAEC